MDAQDAHVLAHVGAAGAALVARPIDDVRLGGDSLANRDARRARSARDDDAGHLMAEDHRRRAEVVLCPGIPALDVNVGAAHARGMHADQDLARAGLGNGYLAQRRTRRGSLLDQREHGRANRRCVKDCRRLSGHAPVVVTFDWASAGSHLWRGGGVHPLSGEGQRRVEVEFVHQQRAAPGNHGERRVHRVEASDQDLLAAAGLAELGA